MKKQNNLPNVWNKAKTNDIPEGAMCINTNEPDKLKIFENGEWKHTDPFKDLEERKIKE